MTHGRQLSSGAANYPEHYAAISVGNYKLSSDLTGTFQD
jgi:hypothetical protein